jgi:hypothetical protein
MEPTKGENTLRDKSGLDLRFFSWRDMILTPLAQGATIAAAIAIVWALQAFVSLPLWVDLVLFIVVLAAITLFFLAALRVFFPIREGVFRTDLHPWARYVYNLHAYLCVTNLGLFYLGALSAPLPNLLYPFSRKMLCRLLGAKMGKGPLSIGGGIHDPFLVTVEEGVMLGLNSLVLPHWITNAPEDTLILRRVTIRRNAIIGAGAVMGPGVSVGAYAIVQPNAFVPMNTQIPAYEVWGGNPAKKVGKLPPRMDEAAA